MRGADLIGAKYTRPFGIVDIPDAHRVVAGSFVTTEDGTGLVHLAPAFGADDMEVSRANGFPVVNPVRPDGRFEDGLSLVGGMFFKDADRPLIADLAERGLLFRSEPHVHSYPHCWRCGTVLLYYALPSWYIRTTAIKDQLLAENEKTNWQPATIKNGRYGEWLRNNVDWALSRTRYWGTPLPLWECPSGHVTCDRVAGRAGFGLAGQDLSGLDPHRPYVDDVTFPCPQAAWQTHRVPEVIDAWFDSGSMPFAQWGAPLRNLREFEEAYPAQFICEAIDQTRGWFYSLMAVGTLVFGHSSYENVVCLGHVVDEQGRKMSKHLGNVMEPMGLMNAHGADAVRWFFAASGSPWGQRRIGPSVLDEIVRKVLLTYWNTVSFLVLYANASSAGSASGEAWTPEAASSAPLPGDRPLLDRWLLSEVHACVRDVTASLEAFDTAAAGRRLAALIDDLSNWYVRRSRRRFWDGPESADGASAFATLHSALVAVTKLMAPITPFLADYVWGVLRPADAAESVHLSSWPAYDAVADRRGSVGADGAGPAACRARPVGAVGRRGADQAAAVAGAGRGGRVRVAACRAARAGGRRAERARARVARLGRRGARRPTRSSRSSARLAAGSGRSPRRSRPRSGRPTRRRSRTRSPRTRAPPPLRWSRSVPFPCRLRTWW